MAGKGGLEHEDDFDPGAMAGELLDMHVEMIRMTVEGVTDATEVVGTLKEANVSLEIVAVILDERGIDYRVVNSSLQGGNLVFHLDSGDEVVGEMNLNFQSLLYREKPGDENLAVVPWIHKDRPTISAVQKIQQGSPDTE